MCPYGCGMERNACMCSDDHLANVDFEERMAIEYPDGYIDHEAIWEEQEAEELRKRNGL